MRTIVRDWQRWSRLERVMSILIVALFTIGIPLVLAAAMSANAAGHHATLIAS